MSAKRRQETLERFSVPIEEDDASKPQGVDASSPLPIRAGRRRTSKIVLDSEDNDFEQDKDYVMEDGSDDDDDFIDDDDDDSAFITKSKSKGKGKANAKPKTKKKAASKTFFEPHSRAPGEENPQVMLISLKVIHGY
jgi:SWI/SNF-related matrix-associated actin-dependent regulator of chromatin subfamily A3